MQFIKKSKLYVKIVVSFLSLTCISTGITGCGELAEEDYNQPEISSVETEPEIETVVTGSSTEENTESETTETSKEETTETPDEKTTEELSEASEHELTESVTQEISEEQEQYSETEKTNIFSEIRLGMSSAEVFEIAGSEYDYKQEYNTYKTGVEYDYFLDSVNDYDVDIAALMFYEFNESDELICFGYHIGETGDPENPKYPYSESELAEAYDSILLQLSEQYGNGTAGSDYASFGVLKENSWYIEGGLLWFTFGVNMWSNTAPSKYENGVNEILLSLSIEE